MLKATIISCLVAGASAEWCIWGDKWCYGQRTTWYGLIMQYSMNLFNYILSFLWELFIVNSLISLTAIMIFCATVAIVLYIKGRPSTLNKDTFQKVTNNGDQHTVSTNIYMGGPVPAQCNVRSGYGYIANNLVKQPREFNNKSDECDIATWFTKLENYFESFDVPKSEWTNLAISWVSESCLRTLPPLYQFKIGPNGYERFKSAMIDKFGRVNRERVSLSSFTSRYQRSDESLRDYAKVLVEMAEKLFSDQADELVNSHLKEQFAKGIRDSVLRAKAIDKFHKIQGKDITFNEFLEYMVGKEAGREDFARSTSESEDALRRGYSRQGYAFGLSQQNRGDQTYRRIFDQGLFPREPPPPYSRPYNQPPAITQGPSPYNQQNQQNTPYIGKDFRFLDFI